MAYTKALLTLSILSGCLGLNLPAAVAAASRELPDADTLLLETATAACQQAELSGQAAAFQREFLANATWQREFFDSGPIPKVTEAIQFLAAIWESDPEVASTPVNRAMATACGLEGPRKYSVETTVERYQYFKKHWEDGRLNDMYEKLSLFERRFLAAGVQHGHFNTIDSMEYQLAEVCLPAERYTGACWYAGYRLHNAFGDSIHGPLYYRPFRSSWTSAAEMVRHVGGVCGSLSNFGAAAAIANGVPALTMGEPGHCAYAVMTSPGNWSPAYSLSWQRGVHTSFFGGSWGWHLFGVASQASQEAAWQAGDFRRRGEWLLAKKRTKEALDTLAEATRQFPLDYELWQTRIKVLEETGGTTQDWLAVHDDVLGGLGKDYPEVAWHLIHSHIYPHVLPSGEAGFEVRRERLLAFHQAITGWGVSRWGFAGALQHQQKLLTDDSAKRDAFVVAAFHAHADDAALAAAVLEAGFASVGDDAARRQQFLEGIMEAVGSNETTASADTIAALARRLLPEAASSGDKTTFQFIGRLASASYPACDVSPDIFPGMLLSSGGTLAIASPGNRYDAVEQHWGVIEPYGGFFHTDAQPAFATVRLGNFGRLSGVVIVQRPSHIGRLNGAKLQVSVDGETWSDIYTFANAQRIERVDLRGRNVDAGYVRVLQENGPSLHFNRFLVFGEKQN